MNRTIPTNDLYARAMWSHLVEPRDVTASALIRAHGHNAALEILDRGIDDTTEALQDVKDTHPGTLNEDMPTRAARLIEAYQRLTRTSFDPLDDATNRDLTPVHPDTVQHLTRIYDMVHILYVRGNPDALHAPSVTITGARAVTTFDTTFTADIVHAIRDAAPHLAITTGGSYGIDGAATSAALATDAPAVIYSAGGADVTYPTGHTALFDQVARTGGAIVSETPPGTVPTRWRFIARNVLLAAHGKATIVPAAGARSNGIETARLALGLGRPVATVPRAGDPTHDGCHYLLTAYSDIHPLYTPGDVAQLL